jgi:ankyrin repeat protein
MNTVNEAQWREALRGFKRGDFSRLEPLFTPDYRAAGTPCRLLAWYEPGAFEHEPQALAEVLTTCAGFLGCTGIAEYFQQHGVAVTAGMGTGMSAFHWAAHRGHLATVRLLLKYGAPLETKNSCDGTARSGTRWAALHEKPRADHLPVLEVLLAAGAYVEPEWQQEIAEPHHRANQQGEPAL